MAKNNFIKKIKEKISEFFEEEPENEEEEINLKTLIVIFLIGFVIIISIYAYTNKGFEFLKLDFDEAEDIEQGYNREIIKFEDYFVGEKGLENSNFSEGTNHWSTAGSISNITLNKKDYYSAPQSLQITCHESSCIIYYDTKFNSRIIDNPHEFNSGIWIGIKPKTKLKISYWYKGCDHKTLFLTFDKYGNFDDSNGIEGKYSERWVKKEITITIPDKVMAFGINIMIGQNGYLLLDDIKLEKVE